MINSHTDYRRYLEADRIALGRSGIPPFLMIQDPIWYYQRLLRKCEFFNNCRSSFIWLPARLWLKYQYKSARLQLGFNIPPNVIGPGLNIVHEGDILINKNARIGSNLVINIGVVIGMGANPTSVPMIGSYVVIEPGAKIFGDITIADWTHIGANAVVNKSITEPGMIVAGIPARIIKPNPCYPPNN